MKCSYRCKMWCNCKKPAKPYPPTPTPPSISGPSMTELNLTDFGQWIYFNYTPTDAQLNVDITSSDDSIAYVSDYSYQDGLGQFTIFPQYEAQGSATVTITNNDNPSETYTISVTVNWPQPEPFTPTNNIVVNVISPQETRNTKSKSRKVEQAGDYYLASVFATDSSSEDYVEMSWEYGDAPGLGFYGKTFDDEHCRAMFDWNTGALEDMLGTWAREIEYLHDNGELTDGSCQFSDEAWNNIETFFETPVTPESSYTLQQVLASEGTIEPVVPTVTSVGINSDSTFSINAGLTYGKSFWTNPWEGVDTRVTITSSDDSVASIGAMEYYPEPSEGSVGVFEINGVGAGTCTITITSVENPEATASYTCIVTGGDLHIITMSLSTDSADAYNDQSGQNVCTIYYTPQNATNPVEDILIEVKQGDEPIGGWGLNKVSDGVIQMNFTGNGADPVQYPSCTYIVFGGNDSYELTINNLGPTPTCPAYVSSISTEPILVEESMTQSISFLYASDCGNPDFSGWSFTSDDGGIATTSEDFPNGLLYVYGVAGGGCNVTLYDGTNSYVIPVTVEGHPILPIETIDTPSEDNITVDAYDYGYVTFNYTPSDANVLDGLVVTSSDDSIAQGEIVSYAEGVATIKITGISNGIATISYYLESDPNTTYDISVTVRATSPYIPTSNTIAYFPLKGDVLDRSNNGFSIDNNSCNKGDYGWTFTEGDAAAIDESNIKFAGVWYRASSAFNQGYSAEGLLWYAHFGEMSYCLHHHDQAFNDKICLWEGANWTNSVVRDGMSFDAWHYFAWGEDENGNLVLCKDGVTETLITNGTGYDFGNTFKFLRDIHHEIEVSDFILDGATWSAQDMVNYYNATVGNYPDISVNLYTQGHGNVSPSCVNIFSGETVDVSNDSLWIGGRVYSATPDEGYVFDHWEDANGTTLNDGDTYTLYNNTSYTAFFTPHFVVNVAVNDNTKGSVDISEVIVIEENTPVIKNGNELTIDNTTITATPGAGYTFLGWLTRATINSNTTITAVFYEEGTTPTVELDYGDISGGDNIEKSISIHGYKVSTINVTGTLGYLTGDNGGCWFSVWDNAYANWYGSYFRLGNTRRAYNLEKKVNGVVRELYNQQALGYQWTDTSVELNWDAYTSEYIYGESDLTYTLSDYNCNNVDLFMREDLSFAFRGDNCTFANARVVVTYEAIPPRTITIISNNVSKGTVDISEVSAEYMSAVSINDNEITIDGNTVTATPESGCYFFTWFNAPTVITDDITITAMFFDEGTNPSLTYNYGTVTTQDSRLISVPGYNVTDIHITGNISQVSSWSGLWFGLSDDSTFNVNSQTNKRFGSYFNFGNYTSNGAYNLEKREHGTTTRLAMCMDLGYGWQPEPVEIDWTSDTARYVYGEDDRTYTLSDYNYNNERLFTLSELYIGIRGDSSTFSNAQVVVTYEEQVPLTTFIDLDNSTVSSLIGTQPLINLMSYATITSIDINGVQTNVLPIDENVDGEVFSVDGEEMPCGECPGSYFMPSECSIVAYGVTSASDTDGNTYIISGDPTTIQATSSQYESDNVLTIMRGGYNFNFQLYGGDDPSSICQCDPCDEDPCSDPSCPGYDPCICDPESCEPEPDPEQL